MSNPETQTKVINLLEYKFKLWRKKILQEADLLQQFVELGLEEGICDRCGIVGNGSELIGNQYLCYDCIEVKGETV